MRHSSRKRVHITVVYSLNSKIYLLKTDYEVGMVDAFKNLDHTDFSIWILIRYTKQKTCDFYMSWLVNIYFK